MKKILSTITLLAPLPLLVGVLLPVGVLAQNATLFSEIVTLQPADDALTPVGDSITVDETKSIHELVPPPEFILDETNSQDDGDPDQPIITGQIANPDDTETTTSGNVDGTSVTTQGEPPTTRIVEPTTRTLEGVSGKVEPIRSEPIEADTVSTETVTLNFAKFETKSSGDVIIKGSKIPENAREDARLVLEAIETQAWASSGDEEDVPTESVTLNYGKIAFEYKAIDTKDELVEYAGLVATADGNIKTITLADEKITMEYEYPAKLFWIFPVNYTATIEVVVGPSGEEIGSDKIGRVKVKFPWWLFFAKDNARDIRDGFVTQYNESDFDFLERLGDDAQLANLDLQNMLQRQQQALQMMSNIAKTMHDTAMAVIRKIG